MADILHQVNNINAYRRMLRRDRNFRDRNNSFNIYNMKSFMLDLGLLKKTYFL
jgi:hypothetical protein